MNREKVSRLEAKGWTMGDAGDFLGLSESEAAYIDMKIALGKALNKQRGDKKLTQRELARMIGSSQSRVAKMEKGDPGVSIDLLVRSLLALGASRTSLAKIFGG